MGEAGEYPGLDGLYEGLAGEKVPALGLPAAKPGLPAYPGEEGPGLHPPGLLNPLASIGAGENTAAGVIPVPGVQGSMKGVEPPSGCHGVMAGVCPPTDIPGIIDMVGKVVETSMPSLHFSASSRRSKAPVPPLGSCPSMMFSLTPCM